MPTIVRNEKMTKTKKLDNGFPRVDDVVGVDENRGELGKLNMILKIIWMKGQMKMKEKFMLNWMKTCRSKINGRPAIYVGIYLFFNTILYDIMCQIYAKTRG